MVTRRPVARALRFLPPLALAIHATGEARAVSVRELVEIPVLSGLTLSPDGKTVAVRVDRAELDVNRYRLTWYTVEVATGCRRVAGDGGAAIYEDPGLVQPGEAVWNRKSTAFFYRALTAGGVGIWQSAAPGQKARLLLSAPGDIESIGAGEGANLVYVAGPPRAAIVAAEQAEDRTGIRVDRSVDLSQSLTRSGWINGRLATQRLSGRWFKREGLLASVPRQRVQLDPATGRKTLLATDPPAAPPIGPIRPAAGLQARSAHGLLAVASSDTGRTRLTISGNGPDRSWQASTAESGRIVWIGWRPRSAQLLFAVRDRHQRDRLMLWDMRRKQPHVLAAADGTLAGGGYDADRPCAISNDHLLCLAAGPVSPPRLVRIALDTGRRAVLFDPNSGGPTIGPAVVRRLDWEAAPGVRVTAVLMVPPSRRPRRYPLFITYYRCLGWQRGGEGGDWPLTALVDAGIAVACVNAPPIGGRQDALTSYRMAEVAIRSLVANLDREGLIDRGRIGMGGFSFGSEVTMWMLTHSNVLRAASIASPQIEPAYYWMNAARGRDQPRLLKEVWGLGSPGRDDASWQVAAPVRLVERITAPLLMQLSEQEARLMPELLARVSRLATPSEIYAFPDEAHFKVQPVHQFHAMVRNLDWFCYWLLEVASNDPAKRAQEERWRAMRHRLADPLPAD